MYDMARNDIHTHEQLQRGKSPGPAGTDGVSWELTACPAAPTPHTHTPIDTHLLGHSREKSLADSVISKQKKLDTFKALKKSLGKSDRVISFPACPLSLGCVLGSHSKQLHLAYS